MPALETAAIGTTLTILSSILSIAASVKQLMKKNKVTADEALEEFKVNAPADTMKILEDSSKIGQIKALCKSNISPLLLKQLTEEAKTCEQRYLDDRQKAFDSERDADMVTAKIKGKRCMCKTLKDIMDHNKGALPDDDDFHAWFDTYECSKYI